MTGRGKGGKNVPVCLRQETSTPINSSVPTSNNLTSYLTAPPSVVPPLLVWVLLAFSCSVGMMLVVVAAVVSHNGTWWYLFLLVFYGLAPIPLSISKRYSDGISSTNPCKELALFVTAGIVVLAFYLPFVLARIGGIFEWQEFILTFAGNIVMFITILALMNFGSWK